MGIECTDAAAFLRGTIYLVLGIIDLSEYYHLLLCLAGSQLS
jgi:hypothetical protein